MASQTTSTSPRTATIPSAAFERFAGLSGFITGLSSLLYAVFFLLVKGRPHDLLPPLFLALGSIFASALIVALYYRVREADPLFALWALLLGIVGFLGAAAHGVHDLATVLIPPAPNAPDLSTLPNQLDPRGFLAFGIPGISIFVFGWLIVRGGQLPRSLGYLGYVLGVLLVALFLGTLFVNDAHSLFILVPGGLASLLANPAWNLWLGATFWRRSATR
ncbi:MAG: DUF4386 family protein [Ktedonobacterales bacterium]|nr:DUF4386 family protein [Ktedonobacterales bacterium]